MSYVKNTKKGTSYISVNQLIQPRKNNGLPPYVVIAQNKMGESQDIEESGIQFVSGKQSGVLQKKSISGVAAGADSSLVIDSPRPGINKIGFIDIDDGANIRTRPAEGGGKALTSQPLPPATRVFIGGCHPESDPWLYVNAYLSNMIVRGYIQKFRITTDLPEVGAKLYQLENGDTVEKLARRQFVSEIRDGYDLRYYENVLLYVNRQAGRNGIKGTFQNPNLLGCGSNNIQLIAGKRIWLVSPNFAKQLEHIVPSGSLTGGAVAKASRIYGHIEDIVQSVTDSPRYFLEVAWEYAEAIYEHLPEIIATVAGFILAESISVSLAASPTGVGQLAALLIQLILALLGVQALVESLGQVLDHAANWLQLAWTADGNPHKLVEASKAFLRMLVSIAIAALSVLGIKGNVGKSLKISNAIKLKPPGLGMSPAMVTNTGQVVGGGVRLYPGSIVSTGPVDIGVYSSMAGGSGKGVGDATKSEFKKTGVKDKPVSKPKLRIATEKLGESDGGPGVWKKSPKRTGGVDYQEQISGVERGIEYKVKEVWFDGYDSKRKILLDAKDWEKWPPVDKNFWEKGTLEDARRQLRAANGTPVEWHVSTSEKATVLQKLFHHEGIPIKIVHTPKF